MLQQSRQLAQSIDEHKFSTSRKDRELFNGHKGKVIWFTGLSGSGKTTIANALEKKLYAIGMRTYVLDGDNIRQGLNKDLGFTDTDRIENIRRFIELAKLMLDAGLIVMTATISPFKQDREMAKKLIGKENFIEIYVSSPLEICEQRDTKGLYKLARERKITNMTGIDSNYEIPECPDFVFDTSIESLDSIIKKLTEIDFK